jgi:TPP-dependent pyruvate/acetoin dehydrogenase alpha subunit
MIERFYRALYRIRRIEEEIARLYPTDKIKSPIHLSIGQEAVAVGVCEALRPEDIVFSTYRSHAHYLAKGGDLPAMIAELYGKATGCARGRGGSMHLIDLSHGVMGGSAVVGTTIPHAVGYALAMKYQHEPRVVVSFFGDGAIEEGVFHESLNFAKLKQLPILFVCENNLYAIHTHQTKRQGFPDICTLVRGYGIPAERIENNDVFAIHEKTRTVVEMLRQGELGPYFLECMTYRQREHVGPNLDFHLGYRTQAEAEPWLRGDPMEQLGTMLTAEARGPIDAEVEAEIARAIAFAESSPFPEASELEADVFADGI